MAEDTTPAPSATGGEDTEQTTDATETEPAPDTGGENQVDWQAEAAKWKGLAKKHEGRAKENAKAAKELDDFKTAQLSEQEKAVKEAEDRGRAAGRAESGQSLAAARIEAALTGVVPDPAAIVEDLNLAKYVTGEGEVDTEAIGRLREKYEALKPADRSGDTPSGRPKENLASVPLPNSDKLQVDEETNPRELAKRIRRI